MSLTKERFLEHVENHSMDVISNNGLHRHLKCSNNGSSNMRFDIVTYPGYLVISGDMGCNVFSRIPDMFLFFNQKLSEGINPGYWGEKLQTNGDGRAFTENAVNKSIQNRLNTICEEIEYHFENYKDKDDEYTNAKEFESAFREEVNSYFNSEELSQIRYVSTIENFESDLIPDLDFSDSWEWLEDKEYSSRFLWQCYAIVWAIEKFREYETNLPTEKGSNN